MEDFVPCEFENHFVEKLFHFAENPEAVADFSEADLVLLMQFLILGVYLNEKHELCFYVGNNLEDYIKSFNFDPSVFADCKDALLELRKRDAVPEEEFVQSVSNYVNKIVIGHVKNV